MDDLVELEAVKYRGLAGGIKTKHKDAGVLGEVAVDELGKEVTHGGCFGWRVGKKDLVVGSFSLKMREVREVLV